MITPSRLHDAKQMAAMSKFFEGVQALQKELEGDVGGFPTDDRPLYLFNVDIVFRHKDDYTVGRIGMDDFLYFEIPEETYGEKPTS